MLQAQLPLLQRKLSLLGIAHHSAFFRQVQRQSGTGVCGSGLTLGQNLGCANLRIGLHLSSTDSGILRRSAVSPHASHLLLALPLSSRLHSDLAHHGVFLRLAARFCGRRH
jgi:hypothetical protein